MSKKSILVTILIILALGAIGLLGFQLYQTQQENKEKDDALKGAEELLEYEKKQTEREIQSLAVEVEGYDTNIGNDTLIKMLDSQKQKIQQLLEEIRTVKYTNGKKISQLKDELSVVRKVLVNYIRQVDSLNKLNTVLNKENKDVKVKINQMTQTNEELTKAKQQLTEVVTRASMLEADNITIETFNTRDKTTNRLDKILSIAIGFNIAKNITASVGEKIIYVRITQPNNEVLTKSKTSVFEYENANIAYSLRKTIEYKGERMKEIVYYKVSETLLEGTYKIEIFVDGQMIGSGSFVLQ